MSCKKSFLKSVEIMMLKIKIILYKHCNKYHLIIFLNKVHLKTSLKNKKTL